MTIAAEWLSRKIILVLGKGGVGTSTLALETAQQLSRAGERTLLCRLAAVEETASFLEEIEPGLFETTLNPVDCFNEYVKLKLKVKALHALLLASKTTQYLQKAAPGIPELVMMGKIWFERERYGHVVVDMPSSGYALTMLQTPMNFARLFPGGPVTQDCNAMLETFGDARQTALVLATLAEEMPAQESREFAERITTLFPKNPPWLVINKVLSVPPAAKRLHESAWPKLSPAQKKHPLWANLEHLCAVAREHAVATRFLSSQPWRFAGEAPLVIPDRSLRLENTEPPSPPMEPHSMAAEMPQDQPKKTSALKSLVLEKRVLILCGAGGVGKTTASGAIGLLAAQEGRRAVVVTIDPAKRLATALGLSSLHSEPTNITPLVPRATGELWAVMPDTNEVFEGFVRSMAKADAGLAARILRTSIYKVFAQEFSGANEYMAMEKLSQLRHDPRFDLIVLDTPPAPNAKAFLQAPDQLVRFFDDSIVRWFVSPGSRLLTAGLRKMLEILEKLTGKGFISELLEFTTALFELKSQFLSNLGEIQSLLHASSTSFIVVTAPERHRSADAERFAAHLEKGGYPFWGFLLNKSLSERLGVTEKNSKSYLKAAAPGATPAESETLQALYKAIEPKIEEEFSVFRRCREGSRNTLAVPAQDGDVHSIASLETFAAHLRRSQEGESQ